MRYDTTRKWLPSIFIKNKTRCFHCIVCRIRYKKVTCSFVSHQESDGEKSDDNLVVDVSNEVRRRCVFYFEKKEERNNDKIKSTFLLSFFACRSPAAGSGVSQRKSRPLAPGERVGQESPGEEGRSAESVLRRLLQQHAFFQIQRGSFGELSGEITAHLSSLFVISQGSSNLFLVSTRKSCWLEDN